MKTLAPLALALAPLAFAALAPGANAAERTLEKTVLVAAPIDEVWKAWTTTEGITSFFSPAAHIDARPDGPFEIFFNPYAPPGGKGGDGMRVLAVQAPRMISFTWNAPPSLPEIRSQRTSVVVRLKPVGERETEVTLHHSGWGDGGQWDETFKYFDNAWGRVLATLQKRFAEGKPVDWAPFLERLKNPPPAK